MKGKSVEAPYIELELAMARNVFGPLTDDLRERVRAAIENPSPKTWIRARGVVIGADRWMTLWEAVRQLDSRRVDPCDVPDQNLLVRALRFATH